MLPPPKPISTGPETPPEHPSVAENPQEQKERDKRQVETKADRQLADMSLDILEAREKLRPDQQETIRSIESLNVHESPEKQKEALKTLRVVVMGVLNKLFDAGMTLEQAKNIRQLPSTVNGKKIEWNDPTETKAFQKVQDMLDSSSSSLGKFWKDLWPRIVEHDYQEYTQRVKPAADSIRNGTFEQTKGNGVVDWIKEHPFVSAGIAIAGAYAVYKLFSGLLSGTDNTDNKNNTNNTSSFKKWLLRGIAVAGGVFLLGRVLGIEQVQDFFQRTFGIDLSSFRLPEFFKLLSEGKFKEAFETLFKGVDKNKALHESVSQHIWSELHQKVDANDLVPIGKMKYKDFSSFAGQTQSTVSSWAADIPGIGFFFDREKQEQYSIVRSYLDAHKEEIGADADFLTVDEVFGRILKAPVDASSTMTDVKHDSPERAEVIAAVQSPERQAYLQRIEREAFTPLRAMINASVINGYLAYGLKNHHDTEQLKALWADLQEKEREYNQLIATGASDDQIETAATQICDLYGQVGEEMAQVGKKDNWKQELVQLSPQLFNMARRFYIERSGISFGIYMTKKIITYPFRAGKKAVGAIRKTGSEEQWRDSTLSFQDRQTSLQREMEGVEEELKKVKGNMQDKASNTPEYRQFEQRKNMLESKQKYLQTDHEMLQLEERISKTSSDVEKKALERELEIKRTERVQLKEKYVAADFEYSRYRWFENPEQGGKLSAKHYEEMDRWEREFAQLDDEYNDLMLGKARRLEELAQHPHFQTDKALQEESERIIKEMNQLAQQRFPSFSKQLSRMESICMWFKTKGAIITGKPIDQVLMGKRVGDLPDQIKMQDWIGRILRRQRQVLTATKNNVPRPAMQMVKGRLLFYIPTIIVGGVLNKDAAVGWGDAVKQGTVDVLPFTGTYSDWYSVFSGQELVTKRDLGVGDRVLRGVFGTAGLVCDIASLAGVGLLGRGVLSSLRAGRGVMEGVRLARAAEKAEEAARLVKAARSAKNIGHTIQMVGFAGALGMMGYSIIMQPKAVEVPPAMKEVMGDKLKELEAEDVTPHTP